MLSPSAHVTITKPHKQSSTIIGYSNTNMLTLGTLPIFFSFESLILFLSSASNVDQLRHCGGMSEYVSKTSSVPSMCASKVKQQIDQSDVFAKSSISKHCLF